MLQDRLHLEIFGTKSKLFKCNKIQLLFDLVGSGFDSVSQDRLHLEIIGTISRLFKCNRNKISNSQTSYFFILKGVASIPCCQIVYILRFPEQNLDCFNVKKIKFFIIQTSYIFGLVGSGFDSVSRDRLHLEIFGTKSDRK